MIDFRYHLVSLVAVFIALAVGIVLGAGPLREGISQTLDDEVAQLRTERTELRADLDAQSSRAAAKDEAVDLMGARAVAGTLTGARVGVVVLPGADRNQVALLEDRVDEAGGSLVLRAELDDSWERPDDERAAVVEELAQTLQMPDLADGPSLSGVLAATLAGADREGQVGAWLVAGERLEDEGILDLTWQEDNAPVTDRRPPDTLLVVSGGLSVLAQTPEDTEALTALRARTDLVAGLAALEVPTVVAAAGTEEDVSDANGGQHALVLSIRDDSQLREQVSTVDDIEGASGRVATALALAWELQEESGHYGLGDGAQAPVPAPPPVRLTTSPELGDEAAITEPVPDDDAATTAP